MGIVNVTPDSFSDGGRHATTDAAVAHALRLVHEGADIIDVGGESTRPGAEPVERDEELRRVVPVIAGLRERSDVVISIDTTKAAVAEAAIDAGADIVNDISAMTFDSAMASLCARTGVGCVLMHTPGRPSVMNDRTDYEDLVGEVIDHLDARTAALRAVGVAADAIAIDPGFGFGKTMAQNYELLSALDRLVARGLPVLVGVSRKRMIRAVCGESEAAIEHGTTAVNAAALLAGARIIRVHDVVAARACVQAVSAIIGVERS